MVITKINDSAARAVLEEITKGLAAGFPTAFKDIGQQQGRSIRLNFERRGRPNIWPALSPVTLKIRREALRRGRIKSFPAGIDAPERQTDTLYRAASAERPGIPHSEFSTDGFSAQNVVDLDYAELQNDGGVIVRASGKTTTIPAREFMMHQDGDDDRYAGRVQADLNTLIRRSGG